jgi:hypothetical protein
MAKYDGALHSFTVETKLRRAAQVANSVGSSLARSYPKFENFGVPFVLVQGRYFVPAATTSKAMFGTVDSIVGDVRKQLAKAKP